MNFGERLRSLRNEKEYSLRKMAEELNISFSALGKYERNEHQPDFDTLEKLADHFDVSIDWLLGRTDLRTYDEYVFDEDVTHLAENLKKIPKEYRRSIVNSIDALYLLLNRQIENATLEKLLIIENIIRKINHFDMGLDIDDTFQSIDFTNPRELLDFHAKFNNKISNLSNELLSINLENEKR